MLVPDREDLLYRSAGLTVTTLAVSRGGGVYQGPVTGITKSVVKGERDGKGAAICLIAMLSFAPLLLSGEPVLIVPALFMVVGGGCGLVYAVGSFGTKGWAVSYNWHAEPRYMGQDPVKARVVHEPTVRIPEVARLRFDKHADAEKVRQALTAYSEAQRARASRDES